MRNILALMVLVLGLSGCGLQGQIDDLKNRETQNESDITSLKNRIAIVESDLSIAKNQLIQISSLISSLQAEENSLYGDLSSSIDSLRSTINSLTVQVVLLQSQVNSSLVQLAILQGYKNIVSIKDPCGVQGSYNEVFLKLSDGHYIASFSDNSNGLNTRFTQLTDGNFVTTDGTHCYFTVSGSGTVISNEHN